MDGNAATRALRDMERNGELEHIPIIGVTANVRGAQQDEMVESGMVRINLSLASLHLNILLLKWQFVGWLRLLSILIRC